MTRPWHRSRLFWLGAFGFIFLLWAWGMSNATASRATLNASHIILSNEGRVMWVHVQTRHPAVFFSTPEGDFLFFLRPPWDFASTPVSPAERCWLAHPRMHWAPLAPETQRYLFLPYWLLTAGYTAAWLTAAACWQHRKNARALKATAALPA